MLLFKLVFIIARSMNIRTTRILRMNHSNYLTDIEGHGHVQRQLLMIPPLPEYSHSSPTRDIALLAPINLGEGL